MGDFEQISEARQLLRLGETATLKRVTRAYKQAAKRYHPDKCEDPDKVKCEEMMKRVNEAYELIIRYFTDYVHSFRQEDVELTYPGEEYLRQYKDRWFDNI